MSGEIQVDELASRTLELAKALLRAGEALEESRWSDCAKEASHASWLCKRLEHLERVKARAAG